MYIQIKKYEKIKNCTAGEVGRQDYCTAGEVGRLCMTTTSFKFMLYCSVAEVYVKLFKNFPDLRIRPFIFSKY